MSLSKVNNKTFKMIVDELREFKVESLKQVLDFVYYMKAKETVDPSQIYFWTKKWQQWERQVEKDKKAGRIIGNGMVTDLLRKLRVGHELHVYE